MAEKISLSTRVCAISQFDVVGAASDNNSSVSIMATAESQHSPEFQLCSFLCISIVATRLRLLQTVLMKLKDKRIKLMNEILSGIHVWKMYAWEKSFNDKVMQIRNSEMSKLTARAFYHGFVIFSFHSAQVLVSYY
jgi:hypothetical protein